MASRIFCYINSLLNIAVMNTLYMEALFRMLVVLLYQHIFDTNSVGHFE